MEEYEDEMRTGIFRQTPEDLPEWLCEGVWQVCGGTTGFNVGGGQKWKKDGPDETKPHTEL